MLTECWPQSVTRGAARRPRRVEWTTRAQDEDARRRRPSSRPPGASSWPALSSPTAASSSPMSPIPTPSSLGQLVELGWAASWARPSPTGSVEAVGVVCAGRGGLSWRTRRFSASRPSPLEAPAPGRLGATVSMLERAARGPARGWALPARRPRGWPPEDRGGPCHRASPQPWPWRSDAPPASPRNLAVRGQDREPVRSLAINVNSGVSSPASPGPRPRRCAWRAPCWRRRELDLGLARSTARPRLRLKPLSIEDAFEPCADVAAAGRVLTKTTPGVAPLERPPGAARRPVPLQHR